MKTYDFINMKDEPEVLFSTPTTDTTSILLMKLVQSLCIIGQEMRERHKENLAERAMLSDMLARFESRLETLGLESDDVPIIDDRRHHSTFPPGKVMESDVPPVVDLGMAQEIDIRGRNWIRSYPEGSQTPDDD